MLRSLFMLGNPRHRAFDVHLRYAVSSCVFISAARLRAQLLFAVRPRRLATPRV